MIGPVRIWLYVFALNGAAAVLFGAFAAHGLSGRLDAHALSLFDIGARYHLMHAVAGFLAALLMRGGAGAAARLAAAAFLVGILLFSGSLYLLALTGAHAFAWITPLGGISLVAGWVLLALAGFRLEAPPL
jgi:uncharacterized membrane protein YgdD (TMEM256/DUF423 family)